MCAIKLIALYFYVCERYEEELKYMCQRFSSNSEPAFTDQETLSIYLYAVSEEKRLQIKEIHRFACRHLRCWFPLLPSYPAFNSRVNRLCIVLQRLCVELLEQHCPAGCSDGESLVDSVPLITCSGKRSGKVARELTAKGYSVPPRTCTTRACGFMCWPGKESKPCRGSKAWW